MAELTDAWKKIIAACATLVIAALIFLALSSYKPRDTRKLVRINVGKLAPGHFSILNTEALRYFAIRPVNGDIYVVAAPIVDGTTPLPENYWWKPLFKCKDFGIDLNGPSVNDSSRFRCRDSGQPAEWLQRWQWDARGRHAPDANNTHIDDLYRLKIERSGNEILLIALETD